MNGIGYAAALLRLGHAAALERANRDGYRLSVPAEVLELADVLERLAGGDTTAREGVTSRHAEFVTYDQATGITGVTRRTLQRKVSAGAIATTTAHNGAVLLRREDLPCRG